MKYELVTGTYLQATRPCGVNCNEHQTKAVGMLACVSIRFHQAFRAIFRESNEANVPSIIHVFFFQTVYIVN
jgi:hypothetical protein